MKKVWLIVLLLAGLVAASYYISTLKGKKELSLWDLVPAASFAVLETENPDVLARLGGHVTGMDELKSNLTGAKVLMAYQVNGNRASDVLIFSSQNKPELTGTGVSKKQRIYENVQLFDVASEKSKFTFAQIEKFTIVSRDPVSVEGVVRQVKSMGRSFRDFHPSLFEFHNLKKDEGNLYIDWPRFSELLKKKSFFKNIDGPIESLCESLVLDLETDSKNLLLNGFALDTSQSASLLSMFREQKPVTTDLLSVVPDRAETFLHFGISNPPEWYRNRKNFCKKNSALLTNLEKLKKDYSFDDEAFVSAVDNEIGRCVIRGDEILFVELKEITKASAQLNKLKNALGKEGLVDQENYSQSLITKLKLADFTAQLFWPVASGSEVTHYTLIENYLIFSGSIDGLKNVIEEIEAESTIKKSLAWEKFISTTMTESNLTLFVNQEASEQSEEGSGQNEFSFLGADKFSIQISRLDKNFYANSVFYFDEKEKGKTVVGSAPAEITLDNPVASPVFLVRNAASKKDEILVQDAGNSLSFLNTAGKMQWKVNLTGKIVAPIEQIDFYKNKKLQYLFLTPGQLNLVDRLGRSVNGYPKSVASDKAEYLSVVDYDGRKNYRFLIADADGKIWIYDKGGTALDGWNPKAMGRRFFTAPNHYRISNRDYFIAATEYGDVHLFNRRGEKVKGFPVSLKFRPSGDLFVDDRICIVSETGRLIKLNSRGEIVVDEVLIKNSNESRFELVRSEEGNSFIVCRKESGKLAVFDPEGKIMFEVANPASENIKIDYHTFGGSGKVLLVTDIEQRLFLAFDLNGKMIFPQPIEVSNIPSVDFDERSGKLIFYLPDAKKIKIVTATLR